MVAEPATGSGWRAALDLRFEHGGTRTVLAHRRHVGPLIVQRPFYPEGPVCHTYVVHPPGGVVGGDELRLDIDVSERAHALVTTPASAKFYRTAGDTARQTQRLAVKRGTLEWLPQDTIFYPGAQVCTSTRIFLQGGARFMGWEIMCLGLPAREERFDAGDLRLNLELWRDDAPLYLDHLHVAGASPALTSAWGWHGYTSLGTMLTYPARREWLDCAREPEHEDMLVASTLVDGVLVTRCLGHHADKVRAVLMMTWAALRPLLLDVAPTVPRIWAT